MLACEVVDAFGMGAGSRLRTLELEEPVGSAAGNHPSDIDQQRVGGAIASLGSLLAAGGLPCLRQLEVGCLARAEANALLEALEARKRMGLPPLTRVQGVAELDPEGLRRIWACYPQNEVTHLEAEGGLELIELRKFLLAHDDFSALSSLALGLSFDGQHPSG